ncbi:hypothetical protein [Acidomonas methanolica]|uniref:Uncharacterized protein n=1 Tax=Acidomonas methanolica NBRC 104435 TaxID=1231351 RepID=A0A023D9K2_ACIMT|nr:hypothetical protein [Acidomonas methanolica]MBU2655847.1 hypothetical protein [Acidomonas methanolica]TCS13755.1 hypothetical protein EDC31_1843 [Acidomonas methanolica]GAJ30809.1 hypothetical protein Amme_516_003 [Acidomonas methanolica NBRC 104435]GBQ56605.1 hypothetical protein AA0498_2405 [Acidomonas methanolica]GEL00811.1 hypothetical protein AME01nite_33090 [Acidomonas methanolica NBRC 104435]
MSQKLGGMDIAKLALEARRSRTKKTLALFMDEHFEALQQELGRGTGWPALTLMFRNLGLKNTWGHEPSEGTVRRTWHRVRQARAKQAERPARAEDVVHILASPRQAQPPSSPHGARPEPASLPTLPRQDHPALTDAGSIDSPLDATSKIERALIQVRRRSLPMPVRMDRTTESDS